MFCLDITLQRPDNAGGARETRPHVQRGRGAASGARPRLATRPEVGLGPELAPVVVALLRLQILVIVHGKYFAAPHTHPLAHVVVIHRVIYVTLLLITFCDL